MVSSSKIESLATRFEPYIDELREFFASRCLPFGSSAGLQTFLRQLRDPAFHEEMGSMVRSILYREDALTMIELTEIIAVAAGGWGVQELSEDSQPARRQILAFVNEVARSKDGLIFSDATPTVDGEGLASSPASTIITHPAEHSPPSTMDGPAPFTLINDRLSQSLLYLQEPREPQDAAGNEGLHPRAEAFPASARNMPGERPSSSLISLLRRSYWIPGVIAMLLAVAAGLLLHTGTGRRHNQIASQPTSLATSGQPKPRAYGAPVARGVKAQERPLGNSLPLTTPSPGIAKGDGSSSSNHNLPSATRTGHAITGGSHREPDHVTVGGSREVVAPLSSPLSSREGVFLASSGAMASHLLSAPAPGYPRLASFTHTEGQVIVQVVVGRDGRVEATRVLDGPRLLRGAAEHAIRHWRYRPYTVDGRTTDVATIVTVSFRLHR